MWVKSFSHHFHTHAAELNCHKMFFYFLCSDMENYHLFLLSSLAKMKMPWGSTQRFKTIRSFLWAQKWFLCVWMYACMCVGASCEKLTQRKALSMEFSRLASALHKRAALCTIFCFIQIPVWVPMLPMEQSRDDGQFLVSKNSSLHIFTFFCNTALVFFKCLLLCTR